MSRWFRMYDEILDDPKVQKLPAEDFKAWVNLLCLASRNEGRLPASVDIAFALRVTEDAVTTLLGRLLSGGLIETRSGGANGAHYAPHGWDKRQYKSDTSAERVKRYRDRYRNATVTDDETAPDTDTETDTERKKSNRAKSAAPLVFEGRIVRLNEMDFRRWEKNFPLLDLPAALQSRDDWLSTEADEATRKKWFLSTGNHLRNLQQQAATAEREASHAPIC